jgi:secondary thiamine-phosphate synthase enzyme
LGQGKVRIEAVRDTAAGEVRDMRMALEKHHFTTTRCLQFVDLTDDVISLVEQSGITNGMALVFSPHTTGAVIVNERETGFIDDFKELIGELVPSNRAYRHDDMELRTQNLDDEHSSPNGFAHCRQVLIGAASQTIPIIGGQLQLGRWQRVFFLECDRARDRRVLIQVLGE